MILHTPGCGWSSLEIETFKKPCSYLTDPALDLADMLCSAINHQNAVVHFDAEGSTYDLIYSDGWFYIVLKENFPEVIELNKTELKNVVKDFVNCIESDIDKWIDWFGYDDEMSKESIKAEQDIRRQQITNRITRLKAYLKENT